MSNNSETLRDEKLGEVMENMDQVEDCEQLPSKFWSTENLPGSGA